MENTQPYRCPTCESPSPGLHPAISGGGEVTRICTDPWHGNSPLPDWAGPGFTKLNDESAK